MKLKKIARGAFAGLLTVGVMTAYGILSVAGAAAAFTNPGFGVLVAAFVFGGMAEGEVYFGEIFKGIKDSFSLGKRLERQFVVASLRRLLEDHESTFKANEKSFFGEYLALTAYLEKIKKRKLSQDAEIKRKQEEAIRFAKKRVALMETYLVDRVLNDASKADYEDKDELATSIMDALIAKKKIIQYKLRFMRFAVIPISIVCGTGMAFVVASQLLPLLLTSTLFVSAGLMGWPLIVMGGLGFAYLMVAMFKDILESDLFAAWKKRFQRWFEKPLKEMTASDIAKVVAKSLALAVVVGLCVAGMVVTCGAMWQFMKNGAAYIAKVTKAVEWVCNAFTIVLNAGTFLFSAINSVKSLHEVMAWCKNATPIVNFKAFWHKLRREESLAQVWDPFRLIARFIQYGAPYAVALCHPAANGLGANQSGVMSARAGSVINASAEFAQDFNFFLEDGDEKTLTSTIIKFIVVSPLLLLSAVYQFLVSQVINPLCGNKPKLGIIQSLKNAFELNKKTLTEEAPAIRSPEWRTSVIHSCFDQEKKRLSSVRWKSGNAVKKKVALDKIEKNILNANDETIVDESVLNKHRLYARSGKQTTTQKFVNTMRSQVSLR